VGEAVSVSRTLENHFIETPKSVSATSMFSEVGCGRVLIITGAGVSAESGIPTFRGKDGYWRNLDPTKLATPSAFENDPKLVWEWYRERRQRVRGAQPNPAHEAIVQLAARSREFLLVTQNVDDLHVRATWEGTRLPKGKIVQIHGDIFVTRCSGCDFRHDELLKDTQGLPKCLDCGALMRPGVVWFGEQLDALEIERVETYLDGGFCDIVIVAGTTATFGYIVDWAVRAAGKTGQLIEVNPSPTLLSKFAAQLIREPAGVALPRWVNALCARSHSASI
jgi:NAD-dependent deacetylase